MMPSLSKRSRLMRMLRKLLLPVLFSFAMLFLSNCGTSELLSDVTLSSPTLQPTGNGEFVDVNYRIGRLAHVTIYLQDADGQRYVLRDNEPREPSTDLYRLRIDGTTPTDDPVLLRKALPSGEYNVVVEATGQDGSKASVQHTLTIHGADTQPPLIDNLTVHPAVISPNADGIDDIAEITYSLPVSATVSIEIRGPGCDPTPCPFITANEEPSPGYTLVDAHLAYRWDRGDGNSWEVFLDGTNLGDEEARPHTSLLRDYAPLPGRAVAFGVRVWF